MQNISRRQFIGYCGCAGTSAVIAGCSNVGDFGQQFVSDQELALQGDKTWQDIKAKEKASTDAAKIARVNRIASRVINVSGLRQYPWEVKVFQNDALNAFALPNYKIGVYTGLLDLTNEDAELAAVIGHEVAHVAADHAAKRVGASKVSGLGLQVAQIGLGAAGVSGNWASLLGAGVSYGIILPYSRQQELEADDLGVTFMARAGYDPREAIDFWQKMNQASGAQPSIAKYLSTHPAGQDRIAAIRQKLPQNELIYSRSTKG